MLSYEMLDSIADAYTPLLAVLSLSLVAAPLFRFHWRLSGLRVLALVLVLLAAYGLMFLDGRLDIWSKFGLDYSTHTAVALALVAFLAFNKANLLFLWLGSLIAYILLMLYQRYHTVSDILTTSAVVLVPVWLVLAFLYGRWPFTMAGFLSTTTAKNNRETDHIILSSQNDVE